MGLLDSLGGLFGGDEPAVEAVEDPGEPPIPVARIREVADDATDARAELDLDFTLDSLDRLDAAAAKRDMTFEASGDDLLEHEEVLVLGSYFGETLIRVFGGRWAYQGGWRVHLSPTGDVVEVSPFDVAARSLAGDPTFRTVADSTAAELEGEQGAGAASDGASDGPDSADATPERGHPPDEDPPAVAERYRQAAERLVSERPDRPLDGSPVSLAHLDRLVAEDAAADAGESATVDVEGLAGYFTEVLRGAHEAAWQRRDGDVVLVVYGPSDSVELRPYRVATDVVAGEETFVETYARAAALLGLDAPGLE